MSTKAYTLPNLVSKVDYCNSVMAGASSTQLRRLQSVLNAAARLVCSAIASIRERDEAAPPVTLAEGAGTNKFPDVRVDCATYFGGISFDGEIIGFCFPLVY